MTDIFISYSRKDIEFVTKIRDALGKYRPEGEPDKELDVWFDMEDIEWSVDWWARIAKGIEETNNFAVLVSADYLASDVCHAELQYARENNKKIIPIILKNVNMDEFKEKLAAREWKRGDKALAHQQRLFLNTLNWLNFEVMDFQDGFNALLQSINTDVQHKDYHTDLTRRALQWDRDQRKARFCLRDEEIDRAEDWLAIAINKEPQPTTMQVEYIGASREAQRQQLRRLMAGIFGAFVIAIGLLVLSFFLFRQSQNRLEIANELGTSEYLAREGADTARTAQADALTGANIERTAAADANNLRETAIFEATVFRVGQWREGTLVAGVGVIPPLAATLSPPEIVAEATFAATRVMWQPLIEQFDNVDMVRVPGGCFVMGDASIEGSRPVHEVCLDEFWIDRYEVTNAQFEQLDGKAFAAAEWIDPQQPRTNVTWFEAIAFCEQRGGRLPTEAEWEYAARGPDSQRYPWGNAWNPENAASFYNSIGAQTVGSFDDGISWVGVEDMSGNVLEWVSTIYNPTEFPYPYVAEDGRENTEDLNSMRALRGGAFVSGDQSLRSALRYRQLPTEANNQRGFRCARTD